MPPWWGLSGAVGAAVPRAALAAGASALCYGRCVCTLYTYIYIYVCIYMLASENMYVHILNNVYIHTHIYGYMPIPPLPFLQFLRLPNRTNVPIISAHGLRLECLDLKPLRLKLYALKFKLLNLNA